MKWDDFCLGVRVVRRLLYLLSLTQWVRLIIDRGNYQRAQQEKISVLIWWKADDSSRPLTKHLTLESILLTIVAIFGWGFPVALFFLAYTTLVRPNWPLIILGLLIAGAAIAQISMPEPRFYKYDELLESGQEISPLLSAILTRKASVSVDYSHGVQALLRSDPTATVSTEMSEKSQRLIFRDLAHQLSLGNPGGDILLAAAIHHSDGCPSWVPDWTFDWHHVYEPFVDFPEWKSAHRYEAINSRMRIWPSSDPDTLNVRGRWLADICHVYTNLDLMTPEEKLQLMESLSLTGHKEYASKKVMKALKQHMLECQDCGTEACDSPTTP